MQSRVTAGLRELGWFDEFGIIMCAARQHVEDVFGANYREQIRLWVAIERGKKYPAAGLDQFCASGNHAVRVRHVFEHFQTSDDIVVRGLFGSQVFYGDVAIVDLLAAFQQMQLGDLQRFVREINARYLCAQPGHALRQDAAAAADIQHGFSGQRCLAVDITQTQGVDVVQRLELAVRIPPFVGKLREFFYFGGIGVAHQFVRLSNEEMTLAKVLGFSQTSCANQAGLRRFNQAEQHYNQGFWLQDKGLRGLWGSCAEVP